MISQVNKSMLQEVGRRGGGDEMVVTRIYNLDGYLVCDLICPLTSASFTRAPVVSGIGAGIDAPSQPWPSNGKSWNELPRVAVMYVSSQTQSTRAPVVVGVLKSSATALSSSQGGQQQQQQQPATGSQSAALSRPPNPDVRDAHTSTEKAKVIVRESGSIDCIATDDFVVRASNIYLQAKVTPLKAAAIASEVASATVPLYDTVNKILEFIEKFPTRESLIAAAQASPQALNGTLSATTVSMKFNVTGVLLKPTGLEPFSLDIISPYTPYNGPIRVDELNPESFDSPSVLISPRD
jgi:hypothetical protein